MCCFRKLKTSAKKTMGTFFLKEPFRDVMFIYFGYFSARWRCVFGVLKEGERCLSFDKKLSIKSYSFKPMLSG